MNKTELIAAAAERSGLTKKDAEKALNAAIEAITAALAEGDKVQVSALRAAEQTVGGLDEQLNQVDILPLVEAAYIVGLRCASLMENQINRPSVVLHI